MLPPVLAPAPETRLKTSFSLCPHCLERVSAKVVEREGRVFMQKSCPAHGAEEVLLASDAALYWNADQAAGPGCGMGCCSINHSCTLRDHGPVQSEPYLSRLRLTRDLRVPNVQ